MARPKRDLCRVTVNLPSHIVEYVDEYAKQHGLTRTTAMLILIADGLAANQNVKED